jgi:hypothetical protein
MKWTIKLLVEVVPGGPVEYEVGSIERTKEVSPATVGLTIAEGKALLDCLQTRVVTEQIQQHVASIKACPQCGKAFRTKGYYRSTLRSVYGKVGMATPARHEWSTSSRAHFLFLLRFETGCNGVSGKPHRKSAGRVARLKAFRKRFEVSENLMS